MKLYVDGKPAELKVVKDKLDGAVRTSSPLTFGRMSPDADPLRQSAFQDFRFYSRELAADEAARLPFEDYVSEIVRKPLSQWSEDEFKVVSDFYFARRDEVVPSLTLKIAELNKELKEGLEQRANLVIVQVHTDDKSTKPPLPILGHDDYAQGYDLVIHDECGADISDPQSVEAVLKPHRDGIPGVNLHCAMHCYRVSFENFKEWFEFTGLDSRGHGAQLPIGISFLPAAHPITKGLTDWTTIKEELYNNIKVWETAVPLAYGTQGNTKYMVVWANDYHGTRVFSTTIGHNNATVEDSRYLDMVARAVLWATGHIKQDGSPADGYRK